MCVTLATSHLAYCPSQQSTTAVRYINKADKRKQMVRLSIVPNSIIPPENALYMKNAAMPPVKRLEMVIQHGENLGTHKRSWTTTDATGRCKKRSAGSSTSKSFVVLPFSFAFLILT